MFQFCRFQKVAVVAGLILISAGALADRLPDVQPPATDSAAKPKHWKTHFEELSLASGKCKVAVTEVSDLFSAYEALRAKSKADKSQKESNDLNRMFGALLSKYLMDPGQECSKRVFIGFMIAVISTDIAPADVEQTTQDIVGGILYGSIKLMSQRQEYEVVVGALEAGLSETSRFFIEAGKLPPLATHFNHEEDAILYLNPRLAPAKLAATLIGAVREQHEYFKYLQDEASGRGPGNKRLASFEPPKKPAPSSLNQRL